MQLDDVDTKNDGNAAGGMILAGAECGKPCFDYVDSEGMECNPELKVDCVENIVRVCREERETHLTTPPQGT